MRKGFISEFIEERSPKGFTLIELLIVITIIGVLVVGILAAINPVEQVRRAQDQGIESDASEFLKACDRYYTAFFEYPWKASIPTSPILVSSRPAWLTELKDKGEIKDVFVSRPSWSKIYITQTGTNVYACFDPASTTFQKQADANGRFRAGTTGCTSNCYDCLPR